MSDKYSNEANQLGLAGVGRAATLGGFGAGIAAPPVSVLEHLKRQREIEAQSLSHHGKLADRHRLNVADLDTAIAALEPAPAERDAETQDRLDAFKERNPGFDCSTYDPSSLAHEEHIAPDVHLPIEAVRGESEPEHVPTVRADWDDEPASVLDDPELIAAADRAEARLDFNDTFRPRKREDA